MLFKTKIGIIGIGYVGGALKNWFEKERYPLFLYDKYKKVGSVKEVNKAEIIFICLPTPFNENNGGYDDSAIIEGLKLIRGSKIIVIKSTILPGSTKKFQKQHLQHKILFNPEFLVAKTAKKDLLNPKRQIVGVTRESKDFAQKILDVLPKAPYEKIILSSEAEMIKYFSNTFLASKVIFANQIYDLCESLNINYDLVAEIASNDHRIGSSHLDVFFDGYRGYAGACFPKDLKSLLQLGRERHVNIEFLDMVDKINNGLINKQGKKLK